MAPPQGMNMGMGQQQPHQQQQQQQHQGPPNNSSQELWVETKTAEGKVCCTPIAFDYRSKRSENPSF